MVSTVWSVCCLLFFHSRCPPCPAICKSGGALAPCPMESAPVPILCCCCLLVPVKLSLKVDFFVGSDVFIIRQAAYIILAAVGLTYNESCFRFSIQAFEFSSAVNFGRLFSLHPPVLVWEASRKSMSKLRKTALKAILLLFYTKKHLSVFTIW